MSLHAGTRPGSLAEQPGFIPYIYGAAQGKPSRGRPELVLAAMAEGLVPETVLQRFERELAGATAAPLVRKGPPRRYGCGTPAAEQQHRRAGEKPCEACRAAANQDAATRKAARKELASAAVEAKAQVQSAPARRPGHPKAVRAPERATCAWCHAPAPDHRAGCIVAAHQFAAAGVTAPGPEKPAAPARCRKCRYLKDSPGHRVMCGGEA